MFNLNFYLFIGGKSIILDVTSVAENKINQSAEIVIL